MRAPLISVRVLRRRFADRAVVVYLCARQSADQTPRAALQPLIDALGLEDAPSLLSSTYADDRPEPAPPADLPAGVFSLASTCGLAPAEACDDALRSAEAVWRRIVDDESADMFAGGPPPVDDAE